MLVSLCAVPCCILQASLSLVSLAVWPPVVFILPRAVVVWSPVVVWPPVVVVWSPVVVVWPPVVAVWPRVAPVLPCVALLVVEVVNKLKRNLLLVSPVLTTQSFTAVEFTFVVISASSEVLAMLCGQEYTFEFGSASTKAWTSLGSGALCGSAVNLWM